MKNYYLAILEITFATLKRLLFVIAAIALLGACKKKSNNFDDQASLDFSTSEVVFDTVFTGIGSATKSFTVYNKSNKPVKISKVFLASGSSSQFRFNLDGVAGDQRDVVIAPNDSAFAFVEVTVNPGNQNNPFILEDEITFVTNRNTQAVKTVAWGQDAYYYFPNEVVRGLPAFSRIIKYKENPTFNDVFEWKDDKPHVIYGYLRVDSSMTLKIHKGTQVHLHKGAGLWIANNASLQIEGEKEDEVVFQGDRLEEAFDERAGQWDRIWINEGAESKINYAIIKNGYVGLQVETTPFNPNATMSNNKLLLSNTIIRNMVGVGIFTRNFKIDAENCLVYESGNQDLAINGGGDYHFKHCTFANYWSGHNRQQSLFFANNYYQDVTGTVQKKDLKVLLDNCILYGNKREEIELDSNKDASYQVVFNHCLLKSEIDVKTNPTRFLDCLVNPKNQFNSPVFKNPGSDDYEIYQGSTAQNKGDEKIIPNMTDPTDLLGASRDAEPDIGCYEVEK